MTQNDRTPADKVQAVIRRRAGRVTEPSLPSGAASEVGLVTITLDELHDLTYTATSRALRSTTSMSQERVRHYGMLAAEEARRLGLGHDGFHRGSDPRA